MHLPPAPNSRELLPPLLACLPTAFVSPQPPPALLPLLSPLLRQRASFLSANRSSGNDGWLPLLSWDAPRAAKLPAVVESMNLEPHPVSGEIEMDDVRPAKYRRLDEETLHARLEVEQFELLPTYLWCETDEHGGVGPGWKLAELRSLEDLEDGEDWFDTISLATDAANARMGVNESGNGFLQPTGSHESHEDNSDDDDYWATYDRTPGRTPAHKRSPAPVNQSTIQPANQPRSQAELDHYARYGTEVQPALDAHDPDEEHAAASLSTARGDVLPHPEQQTRPESRPTNSSLYPADDVPGPSQAARLDPSIHSDVEAPRPISPTSSHGSIERLESQAASMSNVDDRAQMAIKQHISTDIKSLFRLARSTGMERMDFERIVKTELECLSLLEEED